MSRAEQLAQELERFRVAYQTDLSHDIEPISLPAVQQGERLIAAARHIVEDFQKLNGTECSRGCGKCIKCILEDAMLPR